MLHLSSLCSLDEHKVNCRNWHLLVLNTPVGLPRFHRAGPSTSLDEFQGNSAKGPQQDQLNFIEVEGDNIIQELVCQITLHYPKELYHCRRPPLKKPGLVHQVLAEYQQQPPTNQNIPRSSYLRRVLQNKGAK